MEYIAFVETINNHCYLLNVDEKEQKRLEELQEVQVGEGDWEKIKRIEYPFICKNNTNK